MQGRGVPSRARLAGTTATLRGKNDDLGKTAPAQERGRGSGSGKDGLNPVQGPRANPPFPQLPYPDLHLSSTSASGCRPRPALPTTNPALAWQSLSLATSRPPPATSPLSSEPIGARAPPLAASPTTPGLRMAEPRRGGRTEGSQWEMRGGLRDGEGRGARKRLQRQRDRGRRRPRADPSRAGRLRTDIHVCWRGPSAELCNLEPVRNAFPALPPFKSQECCSC